MQLSCTLCGKQDGYYTHFVSWTKEFITLHLGKNLSPDSCICKAHKVEAKRYHSQEGYTPKWKGQVISGKAVQRILIYSPDTDIYNIGLTIVQQCSPKECIVQLNLPHSQQLKYLHLNNLVQALEDDPNLASLPRDSLVSIIQMLFISSGCDYISYFSGLGKAAFNNVFCQHAAFITGNLSSGLLLQTHGEDKKQGFLALVQLIGTLYFKKHLSAFVSLHGVKTPNQLFNSLPPASLEERHKVWFSDIRNIISDRISNEEECPHIQHYGVTGHDHAG